MSDLKPLVEKEDSFDKLDIRVGLVISAVPLLSAPKPAYQIVVDFGKYGHKTSVGRFTQHTSVDLIGKKILGVLNFPAREIGGVMSEFLLLGVQFPTADSGEATPIIPMADAKIGGKLF
ncbi:MAG: tRNA-binding protein [Alphaproteobacteria bacterium]